MPTVNYLPIKAITKFKPKGLSQEHSIEVYSRPCGEHFHFQFLGHSIFPHYP